MTEAVRTPQRDSIQISHTHLIDPIEIERARKSLATLINTLKCDLLRNYVQTVHDKISNLTPACASDPLSRQKAA